MLHLHELQVLRCVLLLREIVNQGWELAASLATFAIVFNRQKTARFQRGEGDASCSINVP